MSAQLLAEAEVKQAAYVDARKVARAATLAQENARKAREAADVLRLHHSHDGNKTDGTNEARE